MSATRSGLGGLWRTVGILGHAVLLLGVLLAVKDHRVGAWFLLAGVSGLVATHIVISVVAYRGIMRRPWPQVEPLPDEWDD